LIKRIYLKSVFVPLVVWFWSALKFLGIFAMHRHSDNYTELLLLLLFSSCFAMHKRKKSNRNKRTNRHNNTYIQTNKQACWSIVPATKIVTLMFKRRKTIKTKTTMEKVV